ncbi:MAG: acetyltransferase [Bryobacteraceae bacterium]
MTAVVLVGGGGHARVIADIIEAAGECRIEGFTSGEGPGAAPLLGYPCLGGDDVLPELLARGVRHAFVAVGDNGRRRACAEMLAGMGFALVNAVSPHAVISRHASLGSGVAVMPGAVVNAGTRIGDGAIVNTNASVDHDCEIGAFAHVCPGSALAGTVRIGEDALLGTGCRIIPGVSVGPGSQVGAGSVVTRDIPGHTVAIGVPARAIKHYKPSGVTSANVP